jgi:hypothetical protein
VKQAAEDAYAALRKLVEGSEATGPATMTAEEIAWRAGLLRQREEGIRAMGGVDGAWGLEQMEAIRAEADVLKSELAALGRPRLMLDEFNSDMSLIGSAISELATVIDEPKRMTFDVSEAINSTDEVRLALDAIPNNTVKRVTIQYVTEAGAGAVVDAALADLISTGRSRMGVVVRDLIRQESAQ